MALFKKKKEVEEHAELPELPKLPDFPEITSKNAQKTPEPELPTPPLKESEPFVKKLPSFQDSELGTSGQEALKSAANPYFSLSPEPQMTPSIMPPKEKRTLEINEPSKGTPEFIKAPDLETRSEIKSVEPVYVRIDKFKAAINNFDEIKSKILEIEDLLRKIRGIKQKEEEELKEWEKEIESIKARIEGIDRSIFSKID